MGTEKNRLNETVLTYVVGTQKNRLNETVLLSIQNICLKLWVRKYLQFYAEKLCLSKPVKRIKLKFFFQEVLMYITVRRR